MDKKTNPPLIGQACAIGAHLGPLVDHERFRAHSDPFWHQFANCAACGSTITAAELARKAA